MKLEKGKGAGEDLIKRVILYNTTSEAVDVHSWEVLPETYPYYYVCFHT